jgi:hypothetical protein
MLGKKTSGATKGCSIDTPNRHDAAMLNKSRELASPWKVLNAVTQSSASDLNM